ncbi:ribonuclease Z [Arthrobacter sp. ISL-69]|uniref:ribonuclease Z n=1 Tax=Arthrobacter sp. ISL-69 TaxID=2819113 RepID=UPI001BE918B7|nr:ribonuclease Z [Arthrobacter sp. ISL-69]MBT2537902.1 ribonuclease Z [Arthrobacter sp. ISL-69]
MRELVVLGTASQVPTRSRNHNGYLLRWDGEGLLFDPGEGTQRQMIHAGVSASQVTRICLTHVHGDHCFGLPGVLSRMVLDGVPHPVHLHFPAAGEEVVRALVSLASPGLDLRLHPHAGPGPVAPGLEVRPLRHRIDTFGYRLVEPDGRTIVPDQVAKAGISGPDIARLQQQGIVDGVRLEQVSVPRPGQSFAFVMDTAECDGAEELADGVDLLVAESTFSNEDAALAAQYLHLTAGQAGALASTAGAGTLVLTHFSSRYVDVRVLAEQAAARAGRAAVVAAEDLDRVPLPKRQRNGLLAGAVPPSSVDEDVDPGAVVGMKQDKEQDEVEQQVDGHDVGQ